MNALISKPKVDLFLEKKLLGKMFHLWIKNNKNTSHLTYMTSMHKDTVCITEAEEYML